MSSGKLLLNVLAVIFVVGALAFVWHRHNEYKLRVSENKATEYQNVGQYDSAISIYIDLLTKLPPEGVARVKKKIAQCYVGMARNPGLPAKTQAQYYRLAETYCPGIVTDPLARKLMEKRAPANSSSEKDTKD